jgi:hypothetical protein
MAKTPKEWHAADPSPYGKVNAKPDFGKWTVAQDSRGATFASNGKNGSMLVTVEAVMLRPPSRWNDDPRQPLSCALSSNDLASFILALEGWALPQMQGGESRSAVKDNVFAESFVRAKLVAETRHHDAEGAIVEPTYSSQQPVVALLSIRPYSVSGAKGVSLRVLAIQAA